MVLKFFFLPLSFVSNLESLIRTPVQSLHTLGLWAPAPFTLVSALWEILKIVFYSFSLWPWYDFNVFLEDHLTLATRISNESLDSPPSAPLFAASHFQLNLATAHAQRLASASQSVCQFLQSRESKQMFAWCVVIFVGRNQGKVFHLFLWLSLLF